MFPLVILALAGQSAVPQSSPLKVEYKTTDPAIRKAEWGGFLKSLAKETEAAVMIDVQPNKPIPLLGDLDSYNKLSYFADVQFSDLKEFDGLYLISRKASTISEESWRRSRLLNWLNGISNEDLADLITGNFTSERIPPQTLRDIMPLIALTDDSWHMYGPAPYSVSASLSFAIDYKDKNGMSRRFSLSNRVASALRASAPRFQTNDYDNEQIPAGEIRRPEPGELDFGDGELLTLSELALKVRKKTGVSFVYDLRLKESLIFISGSFDVKTFAKAFEVLTTAPNGGKKEKAVDERQIVDLLLKETFARLAETPSGLPNEISAEDVLQKKEISGAELMRLFPELIEEFGAGGVVAATSARFVPGITLYFQPGRSRATEPVTTPDGRKIRTGVIANVVVNLD